MKLMPGHALRRINNMISFLKYVGKAAPDLFFLKIEQINERLSFFLYICFL